VETAKSQRETAAREREVVCIRLTGGASDDSVWVLEEGVGGTFLTIGSDPECEWQIRAAGVPAHALSVLLINGMVYLRSGPQRGARLNGALLNEDWQQAHANARIDIGFARLEIKLGKEALLPSLRDVHVPPAELHEASAERSSRPAPSELERSGMRRTFAPERPSFARVSDHEPRRSRGRVAADLGWTYLVGVIALVGAYTLWLAWLD
jgi:hypothetical protein